MTIRPARTDELPYVRETALKAVQPAGIPYRRWEQTASRWLADLQATVLADGSVLVIGFALEGPAGVQVLYVRRKFRGLGLGKELMLGRFRDPVAVGFGPWSDWP